MSDRDEFEKWYQDKFKRAAIESGYETYLTWQAWQAAQAQAVNQQLLGALKQILGWRELRSGANEVPIGRIEDLARAAIAAAQGVGNE